MHTDSSQKQKETIYGGCVVWNEAGILIRGPSGAGKSSLARMILFEADRRGEFASLVSDDRTILSCHSGRLIAEPVPVLAGKLEIRGFGIIDCPFEPAAVIHLIIDIVEKNMVPRVAYPEDLHSTLLGITLQRIVLPLDVSSISAISECLKCFR